MPTIDFTAVTELKPVPEGEYEAYIAEAKAGRSATGNEKIDIHWKVTDENGAERIIFDTLSFHPNALFRVKKVLRALGFKADFQGEVGPEELIGLQAILVVAIDENTGTNEDGETYPPRNRVVKVKSAA
jgi:hypothetical protein